MSESTRKSIGQRPIQEHTQAIETLKVSGTDLRELSEQGARGGERLPAKGNRRALRVKYQPGQIQVDITQPSGARARFVVVPRNLSIRGVGFFHGRFVYPGSACEVRLPLRQQSNMEMISGCVVGCHHVKGLIHEISVRFARTIDLKNYVELQPEEATQAEQELKLVTEQSRGSMQQSLLSRRGDQKMLPLMENYIKGLDEVADRLTDAMNDQDWSMLGSICMQLKGSAAAHGLESLAIEARRVGEHLRTPQGLSTAVGEVAELITLVRSLKAKSGF